MLLGLLLERVHVVRSSFAFIKKFFVEKSTSAAAERFKGENI